MVHALSFHWNRFRQALREAAFRNETRLARAFDRFRPLIQIAFGLSCALLAHHQSQTRAIEHWLESHPVPASRWKALFRSLNADEVEKNQSPDAFGFLYRSLSDRSDRQSQIWHEPQRALWAWTESGSEGVIHFYAPKGFSHRSLGRFARLEWQPLGKGIQAYQAALQAEKPPPEAVPQAPSARARPMRRLADPREVRY